MTFLIRSIDFTASGREIIRDRTHDGDTLTIGRNAENDLHLPDLAVEQHHAMIEPVAGGQLRAIAAGSLGFTRDGKNVTEAVFTARDGVELGFGSYRFAFSQDADGPVTVTQTQVTEEASDRDALAGFALASALPSKRVMAWIALAAILVAFLAIPIYSHVTRDRVDQADYDGEGVVAMDASWSTGALSLAHHGLEDNCEACHVEPFQSVQDETCLTCHESIGDHAPIPRQLTGRGPMSRGDKIQWDVAEFLGKEGPGSCTTCHTEHEGAGRMEPTAQKFCAECHDGMDKRLTDTTLANAADFGTAHPQFKMQIFSQLGQQKPKRVLLSDTIKEAHGLKFPHDVHLDRSSGVTKMARSLGSKGYGEALICADCHTASDGPGGFSPVNMEEDCEACHSLVYDKVGSTFRSLRHGSVDEALADLRAIDRTPRRPITSGRKRPGAIGSASVPGSRYPTFGRPRSSLIAVNNALGPDGVCGECHLPTTTNGRADVMPVTIPDYYLVLGRFDHEAHDQENCTDCHKAESSATSDDLLMPGIAVCRDCHLGEKSTVAEVPSSCAMCHQYHPPSGNLPADHPTAKDDNVARVSRWTR